jgi:glucokinase
MNEQTNNYSIGVDIGGTKMSAVLFDLNKKETVADYKLATPTDNLEKFLVMVYALIDPLVERAKKENGQVEKIGIGAPGIIAAPTDKNKDGEMLYCNNLAILNNAPLGKILHEKYNLPVSIDNDANCFLRAELALGAVKNSASAAAVTLGTGIGGAISINREIYQGVHGSAGEPGFMVIDVVDGTPMNLEEIYHNLLQANPLSKAEEAFRGDELALKAYQEFGKFLGLALASIVNLIDPEIIVIGGGAMHSGELFLAEVKKSLKAKILSPKLKKIKVVPGKLENAGAIGAALL